jgi:glycosyltransferase involved in cell wall biosynthesis
LFPFHCDNDLACHPPFSLTRYLSSTDLRAELWVKRRGPRAQASFVRTALPSVPLALVNAVSRLIDPSRDWVRTLLEQRFVAALQRGDAAHFYRGCSLELLQSVRARGLTIFVERVNTMAHTIKRIMDAEFARLGWPLDDDRDWARGQTAQAMLEEDQAQVDAADFIFSPSPLVTESLRERGVPERKILNCSYGWDPSRFRTTRRALPEIDGVTVLFVGSIGVRKGAHLLLDVWSRAGLRGRLVLAGRMEGLIARHCAEQLARPDVIHLPYHPDPAPVYRSADIFAFPTLEEGSPLVSYEAMGVGLPFVTTPMGAGSIVRHGQEGLILDPHDRDGWVAALRGLAADAAKRRALGEAGRRRAAEYTWDKVAGRRHELIKTALARVSQGGASGPDPRRDDRSCALPKPPTCWFEGQPAILAWRSATSRSGRF